VNATVHFNKEITPESNFHIVYQQGAQYIKDVELKCTYNGRSGTQVQITQPPAVISSSLDNQNYKPSLIHKSNYFIYVCWIRNKMGDGGAPYWINAVSWESDNSSVYKIYGSWDVRSVSSNIRNDDNAIYTAWSEAQDIGSIESKNCVAKGTNSITLNTHGKYLQLCNGPLSGGSTNMRVSAYNTLSSPYYFETSNAIGTSLPKSAGADISYGRGVVLDNGNIGFSYSIKKLTAGDQAIQFVEIPAKQDTVRSMQNASITPLMMDSLNVYLLSEPFSITADMEILFVEDAGFTTLKTESNADSLKAISIGKDQYINCKLELIDDDTQKSVGTIKETNFKAGESIPSKFKSFGFRTNQKDVENVRLKMTLSTNIKDLKGMFIDELATVNESTLAKLAVETLTFQDADIPKTYALDQNYPNPFNPLTQIQYDLAKDSHVSIIVYNVRGQKVIELINGFKPAGSYTVTFDGTGLASGVYFYRIKADEFTDVKRMVLLK
jgi:hypothetical protein